MYATLEAEFGRAYLTRIGESSVAGNVADRKSKLRAGCTRAGTQLPTWGWWVDCCRTYRSNLGIELIKYSRHYDCPHRRDYFADYRSVFSIFGRHDALEQLFRQNARTRSLIGWTGLDGR